jgi:hypothetical protein
MAARLRDTIALGVIFIDSANRLRCNTARRDPEIGISAGAGAVRNRDNANRDGIGVLECCFFSIPALLHYSITPLLDRFATPLLFLLLQQANLRDAPLFIYPFAHVIDREQRDRDGSCGASDFGSVARPDLTERQSTMRTLCDLR